MRDMYFLSILLIVSCPFMFILLSFYFFFFKQKTAYEMRISYWSSDVCSSDLLLLLDIMLPGTSGIDICREVRRTSDVPIIFLSAKGTETDRIVDRKSVV